MNRHIICITLVIISCFLQTLGADKYTDENRPYEFGFNIEGEQHRHEKKDENGIIMGEFGFITADGVYHVTVYATDENGNFKILSMKNIRTKPYPTAKTGAKQGHSLPFPPSQNPPSTQRPQPKPVSIQPPARSCSHCSLPPTKPPQLNDLAVVAQDQKTYSNGDPYSPLAPPSVVAQNAGNPQNFPQKGGAGSNYPKTSAAGPNYSRPSPGPNSQQEVGDPNYSKQGSVGPSYSQQGQQGAGRPDFSNKGAGGPNYSQQGVSGPISPKLGTGGPNHSNQGAIGPNYSQQGAVGPKYPDHGGANQAEYPGQNLQPPRQGAERNPKQYNPQQSSSSQSGQQDPPQARPQKPMLISAQMQIVDKNTDIYKRGPGEKDGLPIGLTKDDMKTLLYTFNYTVGFHGHFEEGYTNGAKQGYYFVTGRNGIRTRVDYVADENGFRPKITEEVLDLLSEEVPKPETEKDEKYGLKGYEFKWLYFPTDAKSNK